MAVYHGKTNSKRGRAVLLRLQDELRERIGSRCVIFISKPYFLEIMPYNCGKGVNKVPTKRLWKQQENSSHMEILQKKWHCVPISH